MHLLLIVVLVFTLTVSIVHHVTFVVLHGHDRQLLTRYSSGSLHLSHALLVGEHFEPLALLLPLVLILHEAVKFFLVVVLEGVHACSDAAIFFDTCLLLLSTFVLDRAVGGRVRRTVAEGAHDGSAVAQQLLWAVLELMTLLSAALAPNAPHCEVVKHHNFEFLCLVGLVQDGLDHGAALL